MSAANAQADGRSVPSRRIPVPQTVSGEMAGAIAAPYRSPAWNLRPADGEGSRREAARPADRWAAGPATALRCDQPVPRTTPAPLMNALILANKSADAKGQLPPSTCKQDNGDRVTYTAPVAGISAVVFQAYPNLKALYAAYTAKVASLNTGQFKQNFSDCGFQATYGEVCWNHLFQHTKAYSVDQMTKGMVTDDQAAGRVFCNYTQGLEYMVWTQDDSGVGRNT
jgi:hypothetical protein